MTKQSEQMSEQRWMIYNRQWMTSNDENDMMNNDDAIVMKIYYNDRWQELLWQKTMRTIYDRQKQFQK